jgi:RNA polymerase sigma factor (sigma-70 family)
VDCPYQRPLVMKNGVVLFSPVNQVDPDLLSAIRGNEKCRARYVKKIIDDHQGFIYKLKVETGLAEEELRDIYTDTVVLVIQHIEAGIFKGDSKLSTYFYRVFYFRTIDFVRKKQSNRIDYTDSLPDHNDYAQNVLQELVQKEEVRLIFKVLDKMADPCRQLIMDWAYWGFTSQEIGVKIGVKDPVKFAKLKHNCLGRFRKLLTNEISSLLEE